MKSSLTWKSASCTRVNLESPIVIKHTYTDDIESLFYIFIWILVLYDGPLGREHEGVEHNDTLLPFWSEEVSKNLAAAKCTKFMFLISKRSKLDAQISPYFADSFPLAELWHMLLGHYVHKEALVPFDEVLKIFNDFLATMLDSKKPLVMANTLHEIVKQHSALNSILPSCPTTNIDATDSKHTILHLKHLHDEVRSMDNPCTPTKCFKAG